MPAAKPHLAMPGFHGWMALTCVGLSAATIAGCRLTSLSVPGAAGIIVGSLAGLAGIIPLLLYAKDIGWQRTYDGGLTIIWGLVLYGVLHFTVPLAARFGSHMPLQDARLAQFDRAMGLHVPAIEQWAKRNWLGESANWSYGLLTDLLVCAVLLPIFFNRAKAAQKFLTANVVAMAFSLPLFALIPAVGPWYAYHLTPAPDQLSIQTAFLHLHAVQPCTFESAGVICFPSFHVIWAVLSAYALFSLRSLRIPVAILSALLVLSTLTTGWHYFADVLAGTLVSAASIAIAERFFRTNARHALSSDPGGSGGGLAQPFGVAPPSPFAPANDRVGIPKNLS